MDMNEHTSVNPYSSLYVCSVPASVFTSTIVFWKIGHIIKSLCGAHTHSVWLFGIWVCWLYVGRGRVKQHSGVNKPIENYGILYLEPHHKFWGSLHNFNSPQAPTVPLTGHPSKTTHWLALQAHPLAIPPCPLTGLYYGYAIKSTHWASHQALPLAVPPCPPTGCPPTDLPTESS